MRCVREFIAPDPRMQEAPSDSSMARIAQDGLAARFSQQFEEPLVAVPNALHHDAHEGAPERGLKLGAPFAQRRRGDLDQHQRRQRTHRGRAQVGFLVEVGDLAQALAAARAPLSVEALSERFSGKGPWKKRLPQLVETLVSLGRARHVKGGVLSVD